MMVGDDGLDHRKLPRQDQQESRASIPGSFPETHTHGDYTPLSIQIAYLGSAGWSDMIPTTPWKEEPNTMGNTGLYGLTGDKRVV
jgi:hypothetical protein